jgi:MFS family permease
LWLRQFFTFPQPPTNESRLCIALFLTNLEVVIVSPSLVGITEDLGGFDRATWIISAYLLGYVGTSSPQSLMTVAQKYLGVVTISAKLSDIFGRKILLCASVSIFVLFSAGCGAAQTLTQLYVPANIHKQSRTHI